jgi:hypothetical protein
MPDYRKLFTKIPLAGLWIWIRDKALDKIFAGIVITAIVALGAYLWNFLTIPARLVTLQNDVSSLQSDVGSLKTARDDLVKSSKDAADNINKFKLNNEDFAGQVASFKEAAAELRGTVKTVDNLTNEVGKLRDTAQALDRSVTRLSDNASRLAAQPEKTREFNHVAVLSKANRVEFGDRVAEFRVPFADAGTKDIKSARAEFVNWPPIWNDISLECLWDGSNSRFRIIARGNIASMNRDIENNLSLQIRLFIVSL